MKVSYISSKVSLCIGCKTCTIAQTPWDDIYQLAYDGCDAYMMNLNHYLTCIHWVMRWTHSKSQVHYSVWGTLISGRVKYALFAWPLDYSSQSDILMDSEPLGRGLFLMVQSGRSASSALRFPSDGFQALGKGWLLMVWGAGGES